MLTLTSTLSFSASASAPAYHGDCYRIGLFSGLEKSFIHNVNEMILIEALENFFCPLFSDSLTFFLQIKVDEIKFPFHNSMTWIHKMQFFCLLQQQVHRAIFCLCYWILSPSLSLAHCVCVFCLSFFTSWISLWTEWMCMHKFTNILRYFGSFTNVTFVYEWVGEWMSEWVYIYLSIEWYRKKIIHCILITQHFKMNRSYRSGNFNQD